MNDTPLPVILVVDDTAAARFLRSQPLRRAGFKVFEAGSGHEALQTASAENPDLIVCDINLPDMNGLELASRLKAATPNTTLQVLHVSQTETSDEAVARGLDTASDAYLIEPVGAPVLLATVRSLLRLRATEQKLVEAIAAEAEARRMAEQANKAKDDFLAMLSHELRTPLNTIMGWLWQLRHESLRGPMLERAIEAIDRSAQLQAQIIRDLADVSLIERGRIEIDLAPVEVAKVVRPVIEDLQRRAATRDVKVSLSLEPVTILADASRLDQIVTNIGNNALQFTPDEGHISVDVFREGADAVIRIADSGKGIEPAFLPHVFERFRQAEPRARKHHAGLGLGLAIVKRLVEMHRGSVKVESEGPGRGATVTVRLQAVTAAQLQERPRDTRHLLTDVRILLVEDEPEPLELLARALREAGAFVMEAATSAEALRLAEQQAFDLLLTDIGLPGLDGVGLMARLRSSGFQGPAVAITAFATAAERARVLAAGFETFLAKPAPPDAVIAAAARVLSRPPAEPAQI